MILVTGGTGLVGAHLLLHLTNTRNENGSKIRATYRDIKNIQKTKSLFESYNKSTLFEAIQWTEADINDLPALEKAFIDIEIVYHCAAVISFDPKYEKLLRKVNIEGTANIVNLCLIQKVKKMCYVSSIAALGDLDEHQLIFTEQNEWNPEKYHSDYAISKHGAEMEVWRGQQEGLEVLIVNPGIIIGPGFLEQGSGVFLNNLKKGVQFYGLGSSGFIAVPDLVALMVQLMESEIKNEQFILVAQNLTYKAFFDMTARVFGNKKPRYAATPLLVNLAYRLDAVISLLLKRKRKLTKSTAKSSYAVNTYSNEKIKSGLNPSFWDLEAYLMAIAPLLKD